MKFGNATRDQETDSFSMTNRRALLRTVGACGISLGGYITSVSAQREPGEDFIYDAEYEINDININGQTEAGNLIGIEVSVTNVDNRTGINEIKFNSFSGISNTDNPGFLSPGSTGTVSFSSLLLPTDVPKGEITIECLSARDENVIDKETKEIDIEESDPESVDVSYDKVVSDIPGKDRAIILDEATDDNKIVGKISRLPEEFEDVSIAAASQNKFRYSTAVSVSDNGEFTAAFDFSEIDEETTFKVYCILYNRAEGEEFRFDGTVADVIDAGFTRGQFANSGVTTYNPFNQDTNSPLLLGMLGLAGAGGTYVGYKKFLDNKDTQPNTKTDSPTATTEAGAIEETNSLIVSSYDELTIQTTVEQNERYTLEEATIDGDQLWVITPPGDDTTTLSTDVIEQFTQIFDHWEGIEPHPNVLTVYGAGMASVPWLAVEKPTGSPIKSQVDTLSTDELIAALQQVCDGLHHVSRYGSPYKYLTTESIYYTDGDVTLRGVLDEFESKAPWYNAPEEFDGDATEQSLVYRLGVVAYELFTGTLPYPGYPTADPEQAVETNEISPPSEQNGELPAALDDILLKALSKDPEDRFETVLHFRDRLGEVR